MSHPPFALLFPGFSSQNLHADSHWLTLPECQAALDMMEKRPGFSRSCASMALAPKSPLTFRQGSYLGLACGITFQQHLCKHHGLPVLAAGHSLGFLSAAVAAEVVPFEAILDLIDGIDRFCTTHFSSPAQGMLYVIGLTEWELTEALGTEKNLVITTRNGQAQFTVSGPRGALETLQNKITPRALKVGLMPIAYPMHSPALIALVPALTRTLNHWRPAPPRFPLVSPIHGKVLTGAEEAWDEIISSFAAPVSWPQVFNTVRQQAQCAFECYPGQMLANLCRWIDRNFPVYSGNCLEERA